MSAGPAPSQIVHASCIAYQGRGALLLGPSGSGKSARALDLLALGAELVADDRTVLTGRDDCIFASAPQPLQGLIEARGAGLIRVRTTGPTRLSLAVDLAVEPVARLPQLRQFCITDACVPLIPGKNSPNLVSLVMACLRYGDEPLFLDPDG